MQAPFLQVGQQVSMVMRDGTIEQGFVTRIERYEEPGNDGFEYSHKRASEGHSWCNMSNLIWCDACQETANVKPCDGLGYLCEAHSAECPCYLCSDR